MLNALPRQHDPRMQLAALTFGHFAVDFFSAFLAPLQKPTLQDHLGCEIGLLTVLLAVSGFWVNLLQPVVGVVIRKKSSGWLLIAAPLLAMLMAGIGLVTSYSSTVAVVLVSGLGVAVYHPEGMLAAHSVRGVRDSLAMPIFGSGGFLGYSTGIKVAAWWGTNKNLDDFWVLSLVGILSAAFLLRHGLHRLESHAGEPAPESGQPGYPFWVILILGILLVTTYTFFSAFLTRRMVDVFGKDAQNTSGTALLLFGLFGACASYGWGWLSDLTGRARAIFLSQGLGLFAYIMILAELHPNGSRASIIMWCFFGGILLWGSFPITLTMARNAKGLTPRLRAGISMGGSWGLASFFLMLSPYWTDQEDKLLEVGMWTIAASAILAGIMTLAKPPQKTDNETSIDPCNPEKKYDVPSHTVPRVT